MNYFEFGSNDYECTNSTIYLHPKKTNRQFQSDIKKCVERYVKEYKSDYIQIRMSMISEMLKVELTKLGYTILKPQRTIVFEYSISVSNRFESERTESIDKLFGKELVDDILKINNKAYLNRLTKIKPE